MSKTIHFEVTDELYYKLVALKAQLHKDSWAELMEHITQPKQTEQQNGAEQTKRPNRFIQITEKATAALQTDKPTGTENEQKQG